MISLYAVFTDNDTLDYDLGDATISTSSVLGGSVLKVSASDGDDQREFYFPVANLFYAMVASE